MKKWFVSAILVFIASQCDAQTAWVRQPSGITSKLRAVAFFDSLRGFAAGDECVKTTDGGKHWILVPEFKHCNDLIIDDFGILWLSLCDSVAFSLDGGKTFNKYGSPCINRLASHNNLLTGSADNFYLNNSRDSGKSWKSVNIINGNTEPSNLHGICYSSNFSGVVVGDYCFYYGSTPPHFWIAGVLRITVDSGKNWNQPSEDWRPHLHGGQLYAVQSLDSLNFIIAGDSSYIARIIISKSGDINNIITLKPSQINDTIFYDVHFFNLNQGFVIGSYGTIFYTENGGKRWSKIPSPDPTTLSRITFTDSARGWIVGANGVILHTDNGGWVGGTSEVSENRDILPTALSVISNPVLSSSDFSFKILVQPAAFELFDAFGRSLLSEEVTAGQSSFHLDMQRFPAGMYFGKLGGETVRFIKM